MYKLLHLFFLTVISVDLSLTKDVHYNFTVNYFCGAPDGVRTCNILGVNGQFPGPTIEGNIGDTLHISLRNDIQLRYGVRQNLTLHSHGLLQKGTPFQDGPEMVTQCPVTWNHTMQYVFKMEQSGTYWYHSHVHWQYSEGMWGPMIIHNTPEVYAADYDDEIVITLSDWYHTPGHVNTDWFLSPASKGNEPIPFSVLMNGRGRYPCDRNSTCDDDRRPLPPIFRVQKGKRYRIRVINTSAITAFMFSIAKHNLAVIEVDGVDTVKVTFDKVPISPAQRYSFIVSMDEEEDPGMYCIRAKADLEMFSFGEPNINPNPEALIPTVFGVLLYTGLSDRTNLSSLSFDACDAEDDDEMEDGFPGGKLLQPYDEIYAPANFNRSIVFNVDSIEDDKGVNYLTFNEIIFKLSNEPLLTMAIQNKTLPEYSNPVSVELGEVVQIVINNHDD